MKNVESLLLIISFLLLFSCSKTDKQSDFPVIDVTKTYPKKEIVLQDIADVQYIPLETRDDVLIDKDVAIAYTSKDTTILCNGKQGDVFIFDGKGKILNKFNHKGQEKREYTYISILTYLPQEQELLIQSSWGAKQILVYDISGTYKRSLKIPKGYSWQNIVSYNDSLLLCYDAENSLVLSEEFPASKAPFFLVSKQDGHIVDNLDVSLLKRLSSAIITKSQNIIYLSINHIIPFEDSFLINEISTDTIYNYTAEQKLVPFLVKSPPIQKVAQEKRVWVNVSAISQQYIFLSTSVVDENKPGYIVTDLFFDRLENKMYQLEMKNTEYLYKKRRFLLKSKSLFDADLLIDALREDKLKGKLKAIAENLKEDDNPVLMKVTLKN